MRGLVCAAPSFAWAIIEGYRELPQVLGMGFGVAVYVVAFAWLCSCESLRSRSQRRFVRALRLAPWVKLAWIPISVVAYIPLVFGGVPGVFVALIAGGIVLEPMVGDALKRAFHATTNVAGFGDTLQVTVAQGAFVSLELVAIAFAVFVLKEHTRKTRQRQLLQS